MGNPRKRRKHNTSVKERTILKIKKIKENHPVLSPCDADKCRRKCISKIDDMRRRCINNQFWDLNWAERRNFIYENAAIQYSKIHRVDNSSRNNSFRYFFKDENRDIHRVCKPFFLTTLGFKRTNDWIVHSVLKNTKKNKLVPEKDRRGCQPSANKIDKTNIEEHIET